MPCAARTIGPFAVVLLFAMAAQAQHDCAPYRPTEAGEEIRSSWGEQFEKDEYKFTVPSDPGGGYVIARIETHAPSRAQMRIIPPSGQGVVTQHAPDGQGPSPQVLQVAFEAAPSTTFDVEIFEDVVSQPAAFPVPYTWSWKFVGRVDCYEPNNGSPGSWPTPAATAKTIPLNQVLEAYSLAGHISYTISAGDAHNFDWYKFTLTAPTEVWLATVSVPTDQRIRIRLFDGKGGVVVDSVPPLAETGVVGPRMLQPGDYYLDLHPEVRGEREVTLSEGESLPDHFDRPYQFVVSTSDPRSAVLEPLSPRAAGAPK